MNEFCAAFCNSLKAARASSGLGQIAFARKLGLSQPVYARYEKGDREPSLNGLIRIAQTLETTPNALLGFAAPPSLAPRHETNIKAGDNSLVAIGNNITQTINQPKTRKAKK